MKHTHMITLFSLLTLTSLSGWAQSTAFDIAGSVKTVNKSDRPQIDLPRGEVKIEEKDKILEINLRRTNPNVSGEVTVKWMVLMKDTRGQVKPVTKGQQNISLNVGVPAKLESDSFTLKKAEFDFNNRNGGNDMEQEVEGYAIIILNGEGEEVGAKFQPGSLEKTVREWMAGEKENQQPPATIPGKRRKLERRKIGEVPPRRR